MTENNGKGRPPKYLTVQKFEEFTGNDFRHLSWKVNFLVGAVFAVLGISVALICQYVFR